MSFFTRQPTRLLSAAAATFVLIGVGAVPSAARPDPGFSAAHAAVEAREGCPLERVGPQYTRCDDLTGNGVPAPTWIPQR